MPEGLRHDNENNPEHTHRVASEFSGAVNRVTGYESDQELVEALKFPEEPSEFDAAKFIQADREMMKRMRAGTVDEQTLQPPTKV